MALPRARMTNDRSTGVAINVKLAGIGTCRRLLRDRPLAAAYYAACAVPPGKESRCVFITIPGWLAGKPVALNCTLVQVGDPPFTIREAKEITSTIPVHTVCMIQVVREDADPSLFPSLQDGFAAYLRKLGLGRTLKRSGVRLSFQANKGPTWISALIFTMLFCTG